MLVFAKGKDEPTYTGAAFSEVAASFVYKKCNLNKRLSLVQIFLLLLLFHICADRFFPHINQNVLPSFVFFFFFGSHTSTREGCHAVSP
jgi:uncharacterized membrane protein YoaK (UPF0700 family)